ncbi:MAG: site-2 protease family protein [Clostridia bacterium]|nr:site-2 protease family protein [Clostridia bacterium]
MVFNLSSIMDDPLSFLTTLLLYIPGMMLAISIHESAHGWVAEKCGDPTARYAGRITLNPAKHFDPLGFLCMLFVGFGWAKPVPVNPLLYKHYRKDDLKVSLAGITANLCLFLICFILTQAIFTGAIAKLPEYNYEQPSIAQFNEMYSETLDGSAAYRIDWGDWSDGKSVMSYGSFWDAESLYKASSGFYQYISSGGNVISAADIVVTPAFGKIVGILYQMLCYCMLINLSLAVFNLIPLPPLDGYHVLNDLVLHQDLFAQRRTQQIAGMVLMALIMLGNIRPEWDVISIAINWVRGGITGGLSTVTRSIAQSMGIL